MQYTYLTIIYAQQNSTHLLLLLFFISCYLVGLFFFFSFKLIRNKSSPAHILSTKNSRQHEYSYKWQHWGQHIRQSRVFHLIASFTKRHGRFRQFTCAQHIICESPPHPLLNRAQYLKKYKNIFIFAHILK